MEGLKNSFAIADTKVHWRKNTTRLRHVCKRTQARTLSSNDDQRFDTVHSRELGRVYFYSLSDRSTRLSLHTSSSDNSPQKKTHQSCFDLFVAYWKKNAHTVRQTTLKGQISSAPTLFLRTTRRWGLLLSYAQSFICLHGGCQALKKVATLAACTWKRENSTLPR